MKKVFFIIATVLALMSGTAFAGLQEDVDALSSTGGTIVLNAQSYMLTRTLLLPDGVSLIGQGSSGPFAEQNNISGTEIKCYGGIGTIIKTANGWHGIIKGLTIDGGWNADIGLHLDTPHGAFIQDVVIRHTTTRATYWTAEGSTSTFNRFNQVYIYDNQTVGLDMESLDGHPITLNTFVDCRFSASRISLRFEGYVDTNTFIGGRIESQYIGIAFENMPEIYNNRFFNVPIDTGNADALSIVAVNESDNLPNTFYGTLFGGFGKNIYTGFNTSLVDE